MNNGKYKLGNYIRKILKKKAGKSKWIVLRFCTFNLKLLTFNSSFLNNKCHSNSEDPGPKGRQE